MPKGKIGKSKKDYLETILFTIPSMIFVAAVFYIPFIMSSYYSLTKWNGISQQPVFIGLDNFKTIFSGDPAFVTSLIFTAKYTVGFVIFVNIFALLLAVFLVQKFRIVNGLRSLFFLPYIMSMIIVGFIWKFIFSQGFAVFYNYTHLGIFNLSWLGNPNLAFYSVLMVGVWQAVGFYMVIYIAGLQSIPKDVLEAATVDGAGSFTTFFKITIPLLKPSVITCIFMSLINGLKVFDIILALTKGGPGTSTYSVTLNIYNEAFTNNNYGLGSAESVIFFAIVMIITVLVLKVLNGGESES